MSSIQGGTRGQAQRWARVERDLDEEKTHTKMKKIRFKSVLCWGFYDRFVFKFIGCAGYMESNHPEGLILSSKSHLTITHNCWSGIYMSSNHVSVIKKSVFLFPPSHCAVIKLIVTKGFQINRLLATASSPFLCLCTLHCTMFSIFPLFTVFHRLSSVFNVLSPFFCFQCVITFILSAMFHLQYFPLFTVQCFVTFPSVYVQCVITFTLLWKCVITFTLLSNVSSPSLCCPVFYHLQSVIHCFIIFTLLSIVSSSSLCYPLFLHLHSVIHCFIIFTLLSIVSSPSLCYPVFLHHHSVIQCFIIFTLLSNVFFIITLLSKVSSPSLCYPLFHHLHSVIHCFIFFTLLSSVSSSSLCYPMFLHHHSVIQCFFSITLVSNVSSSSRCYPVFHHLHSVILCFFTSSLLSIFYVLVICL